MINIPKYNTGMPSILIFTKQTRRYIISGRVEVSHTNGFFTQVDFDKVIA